MKQALIGVESARYKDVDSQIILDGGRLFVVGYGDEMQVLNPNSGELMWKVAVKSGSNMQLQDERLYISSAEGRVLCLNAQNGKRLWGANLYSGALSSPQILADYLLVGTEQGQLFVFAKEDGKIVQNMAVSGGFLSHPVVQDGRYYFTSGRGQLTSIKTL